MSELSEKVVDLISEVPIGKFDKDKYETLDRIKSFCQHNSKIVTLNDNQWRYASGILFNIAAEEKVAALKPKRSLAKPDRCSAVTRAVADLAIPHLVKLSNIKALVKHIIDYLPTPNGLFEPVALDYVKLLQSLLEFQPHVEHLGDHWTQLLDFCLQALKLKLDATAIDGSSALVSTGRSSARSTFTGQAARSKITHGTVQLIDGLVVCICQLFRATNAPCHNSKSKALDLLVRYLQSGISTGRGQYDAMVAINFIVERVIQLDVQLVIQTANDLLPLFTTFWTSKNTDLRDALLSFLILTRLHIFHSIFQGKDDELRDHIDTMVSIMRSEYSEGRGRDLLNIDDLRLDFTNSESPLFYPGAFCFNLKPGLADAERQWSIVYFIAFYSAVLDDTRSPSVPSPSRTRDAKRTRIETNIDSLTRMSTSSVDQIQISTLQILAFMMTISTVNEETLTKVMNLATECSSAKNPSIGSWAMLLLTNCILQNRAGSPNLSSLWFQAWQIASGAVSLAGTSRAACHLLDMLLKAKLVQFSAVSQSLDMMIQFPEFAGPAAVAESSFRFWTTLTQSKISENPNAITGLSESLLRWLFARWTPSSFNDRIRLHEMSSNGRTSDLLTFLSFCTGHEFLTRDEEAITAPRGSVMKTWIRYLELQDIITYLLLPGTIQRIPCLPDLVLQNSGRWTLATKRDITLDTLLLDFCIAETNRSFAQFQELSKKSSQRITGDMLELITNQCLVNDSIRAKCLDADGTRRSNLDSLCVEFTQSIRTFTERSDVEQSKLDAILLSCYPMIPSAKQLNSAKILETLTARTYHFICNVSNAAREKQAQLPASSSKDLFSMDLDDGFDSQTSQAQSQQMSMSLSRDHISVLYDIAAFRTTTFTNIVLLQGSIKSDSSENFEFTPAEFWEYILSLDSKELCYSWPTILKVMENSTLWQENYLQPLLEQVTSNFLGTYTFDRHESAMSACLDVLILSIDRWTLPETGPLSELGLELYDFFIKNVLGTKLASTHIEIQIVRLVFEILDARTPDYKPIESVASVKMILFNLLKWPTPVQYHVAHSLPRLFNHFTYGDHEGVFNNIFEELPVVDIEVERMSTRILVFSKLASSWNTLLRRCIYHIFESAAKASTLLKWATLSINQICSSLNIVDGKMLFRLFASQILYTWLENHTLESIPYTLFKYQSLEQLLRDVEDEISAQAIMRLDDEKINFLSQKLGRAESKLLSDNFAKIVAYCFAHDSDKERQNSQKSRVCEGKLKAALGEPLYVKLVQTNWNQILAAFFLLVGSGTEPSLVKFFNRETRENFKYAAKALEEMRSSSISTFILPPDQQPVFHASLLVENLIKLHRRTGRPILKFWSAANYVYIMRTLLQRIHPALGSLHACTILRKLRVFIALSGSCALSGYPLEMTLHALRPFLTDRHCANDAIGIVRYLLGPGLPSLLENIRFVSGFMVSTLISLRKFVSISQDSTTQESEHQATMSRAKEFRDWFINDWCKTYESSVLETESRTTKIAFSNLMDAAIGAQSATNASLSTPESKLLRAILTETRSGSSLLSESFQNLTLQLLCTTFKAPTSYRDDTFGDDSESYRFADEVWRSCRVLADISEPYLLWAGRVLGRAYLSAKWTYLTSPKHQEAAQLEKMFEEFGKSANGARSRSDFAKTSQGVIIRALYGHLISDSRTDVGFAEDAMRDILQVLPRIEVIELLGGSSIHSNVTEAMHLDAKAPSVVVQPFDIKPLPVTLSADLVSYNEWVRDLALSMITATKQPFLTSFSSAIYGIDGLAEQLLAPITHLLLLEDIESGRDNHRTTLSQGYTLMLRDNDDKTFARIKALLNVILYLRQRSHPHTNTVNLWDSWLDLDLVMVSMAAEKCGMHTSALLFAELCSTAPVAPTRSSQRKSLSSQTASFIGETSAPNELLTSIYQNIDEPDSFYGVHQNTSLASVMQRLDYENAGYKALLFHNARLDSNMRQHRGQLDPSGIVQALSSLNLNSVNHALLQNFRTTGGHSVMEPALQAARKLGQWDLQAPEKVKSDSAMLFKVFQKINFASDTIQLHESINTAFLTTIKSALKVDGEERQSKALFRSLAMLAEVDEVVSCSSYSQLKEVWKRMSARDKPLASTLPECISTIFSSRETLFRVLSQNKTLQKPLRLTERDTLEMQARTLLKTCLVSKDLQDNHDSLGAATYLIDMIPVCRSAGIDIEAKVQEAVADILWAQGEQTTSINMLKALSSHTTVLKSKELGLRASILAKLGHHIGEARLENAASITQNYLAPALQGLGGQFKGESSGRVLHEFASFCDKQLHNPELVEEFDRFKEARERRKREAEAYQELIKNTRSKTERERIAKDAKIASRWFKIDQEEFTRLTTARESLMRQSIEHYLRSLSAWDEHDNDVLRLFSIWLEYSDSKAANDVISHHIGGVLSSKFAVLMNQLSSLLQEGQSLFQGNLKALILRICLDHPHHSLHHIFATLNNSHLTDDSAILRRNAAEKIAHGMRTKTAAKDLWNRYWQADTLYHSLAMYQERGKLAAGRSVPLEKFEASAALAAKIKALRVPPATMDIALRKDGDYSHVPITVGFSSKMIIASGISAPKILTARASNGQSYKQLYKSGNDDLRQDAIMEQVFGQTSQLLKNHASTRKRKLHIRTYKVLPLSGNSGIIEFVPDTIPLSDYLQPAHTKYHPSDWSWSRCREKLASIHQQTTDTGSKVRVFQEVEKNFHPVLRFFYLERFADPDDWFEKRLAYTRSTAAISMLGHVLGLGDRHCHNILLDQKSGEVVHIDLGIAFEAGRILPVPEVVPFRLSRDIVDAFGITKVEGVFRRCCEFTLDALREEQKSIMTLLNVLRFDPLVNWTVSPLRAKRLQSEQAEMGGDLVAAGPIVRSKGDEGPADRALSVVEKKLSKIMSTQATVSELIQQASDPRNLAVLYPGWAPWA